MTDGCVRLSALPRLRVARQSHDREPHARLDSEQHVWRAASGEPLMYGYRRHTRFHLEVPGVGHYRFDAGGESVVGIPAGEADARTIQDVFHRLILPLAAQALGRELLHASAIRTGAGVVAFSAASGAGKSTLAWALSRRGFAQWADDVTVVEQADGAFRVVAMPFGARLRRETAAVLASWTDEPRTMLPQPGPDVVAPLAAICLLERQVVDSKAPAARLTPLARARAFSAVLAHAESFEPHAPGRRQLMLEHYLELAARVPVFNLVIASGLDRLPEVLDVLTECLAGLPSGGNPCAG